MKRALGLLLVAAIAASSFVEFIHQDEHTSKVNKGCKNRSAHFEVPAAVVGACWMQALQNIQFVNVQVSLPAFVKFKQPEKKEHYIYQVGAAVLRSRGPPEA